MKLANRWTYKSQYVILQAAALIADFEASIADYRDIFQHHSE